MTRMSIAIVLLCAATACGDKDNAEAGSASAAADSGKAGSTGAAPAKTNAASDAKPARKAKTTLTEKQLKEAYDALEPVPDFKKHREMIVAKLGQPMKEDGDKAFWYGITPADGAKKEGCFKLEASPTKGNGTSGTDDSNCWE